MYESEVYIKTIQESLPSDVWEAFSNTPKDIESRSLLHWTEHCTECAMPGCFKTCDLYTARVDGKCQRFVEGIERVIQSGGANHNSQVLKIQFKKWGVLATQGNNELYHLNDIEDQERHDLKLNKLIHRVPLKFVKKKLVQKRYSEKKKRIIREQNTGTKNPDGFLLEIYNPGGETIPLGLVMRNDGAKYGKMPFQYRIELKPGYNKELIPFDEIAKRLKTERPYRINLTPEDINSETPLYFGVTEFVQLKNNTKAAKQGTKKIKCIVWDLDNTIWHGTLVEDGMEKLRLKEGIKDILEQVEQKGIVNSIASKNNHDTAMEALKHFDIDTFFLYPKISWSPKSKGIKEIALDLNVNANTLLFVDDSEFERKEIETTLPQVKLMDAIHYQSIPSMEELQVPVTDESMKRKTFYTNEAKRKVLSDNYEGEYFEFLHTCNIELDIETLKETHFERVYELTQRTNQMNFSGNRYTKDEISKIHTDVDLSAYVLRCKDQFGDYGIIGFGILKKSENRLIDLMFSCRIQSKRVEHAFLTHVLKNHLEFGDFWVTYKHTEKNKFSAQVFYDFKFDIVKKEDALRELKFQKGKNIPNDKIITVTETK